MKKFWFSLLILSFTASLFGQVKFNLSYLPETQTYTVSVMPDVTFPEPKNTLSSAQIVIRADFGGNFTPLITSLVDGLVWADNAYVDYPAESPEYTYVCIALVNGPTKKIPLLSSEEVKLFSFKNAGNACPGRIELVSNDDPEVQVVRASGFNVTQHFGVLGARGNAWGGILNGSIECAGATGLPVLKDWMVREVQIAPIPADRRVTIHWQNISDISQRMEMVITNSRSLEVYREKMSGAKGESAVNVDVSNWPSGVYNVRFQFDNGGQTRGWHFMVIR